MSVSEARVGAVFALSCLSPSSKDGVRDALPGSVNYPTNLVLGGERKDLPTSGALILYITLTINENLEAIVSLTDEAIKNDREKQRAQFLSRIYFGVVGFVVVLILLLIFGIVSVVNAKPIKERVWLANQSRF